MDIYTIGEERCIDGTWGRMVGKRFYTHVSLTGNNETLTRLLDIDGHNPWYICLSEDDKEKRFVETILISKDVWSYKQKPIEYKRGDVVWVFDDNKWQPVYYWSENPISVGGFVCIKSFTADGKAKMGNFILTSEVYSKLPIEIQ